MQRSTVTILVSLVFFLSAGAFLATGYRLLAAVDVLLGVLLLFLGLRRNR